MDDLKMQKQTLKKAYKKTKRKHITPWKILAIICAVVMIVSIPLSILLQKFDNTMAARFGGSFWKLQNEDANAQYYTSDFNSAEEMVNYGLALTQQVEAEGAALLMNNNNALPLAADAKVSTFSSSSVNLVYGGTGSGNIDASTADTLRTALEKVGVTVNPTLWDFYTVGAGKDYARSKSGTVAKSSEVTAEVPWDVYTDEVKDSVAQYGDAAIVTLSRVGGEGADLSYGEVNYLALDENEKAMLQNVAEMKKNGTVKKTILLINSANALQVDFLKNNEYDIDAALWIGDVGISGINAVAEILTGKVNPSGSLVDTYCYDNFSAPAMWNFTPTTYEGYVEGGDVSAKAKSYMIYQEGIYVGYKYYETRYEDFVTGNGNAGDYAYGDIVAYPFGYGMSYTDFDISDMNVNYNAADDTYTVTVKVTNTGDMAGKKTVQVYVQSPNYFGVLEDMDAIVSAAHGAGAKVIMGVNPISLGLLKTPGEYGVDIAVGEGQPLGMPLSFGGPYLGFMTCKKAMMRKLPGRIVGQTTDAQGNRCFVLTLQAREQHIRREKASSNICSNEALCAMTASVYLAAMGPRGLRQVAETCASHAHYLAGELAKLGFSLRSGEKPFFHEFCTDCPMDPALLCAKLEERGILGGLPVDGGILWCCTELNTKADMDQLIAVIGEVLGK